MIGASRRRGTIAGEIFHNLLANDFAGAVYPVNPTAAVVQSVKAYPTVGDIPDEVDLALLVVPRDKVLAAVEECGQKGVRALVVISAGFGETGAEGRALQDAITRKVRGYGMRMVGPNCLGILNTAEDVRLDATFAPTWPPAGNVAFSSQSGALGLAILDYARDLGIGVRQFVSMGNKADVSGNDLVSYWGADPTVKVILLYLESLGNPRRFMDLSRKVSRVKPIVVVKSGRTEAGARAASSHTGALAGLDVAVDAGHATGCADWIPTFGLMRAWDTCPDNWMSHGCSAAGIGYCHDWRISVGEFDGNLPRRAVSSFEDGDGPRSVVSWYSRGARGFGFSAFAQESRRRIGHFGWDVDTDGNSTIVSDVVPIIPVDDNNLEYWRLYWNLPELGLLSRHNGRDRVIVPGVALPTTGQVFIYEGNRRGDDLWEYGIGESGRSKGE